jgi:hypothetical protein
LIIIQQKKTSIILQNSYKKLKLQLGTNLEFSQISKGQIVILPDLEDQTENILNP